MPSPSTFMLTSFSPAARLCLSLITCELGEKIYEKKTGGNLFSGIEIYKVANMVIIFRDWKGVNEKTLNLAAASLKMRKKKKDHD